MDELEILYYRINRKSNLILFDDIVIDRVKQSLAKDIYNEYKGQNFQEIGEMIVKLIKEPHEPKSKKAINTHDKIIFLVDRIKNLKKLKPQDINNSIKICQQISSKTFNTSFSFSNDNINNVSSLLTLGILKLIKKKKFSNYENFIMETMNYKGKNFYLVKNFKSEEDFDLPTCDMPFEILLLLELFQNIKTLEISIQDITIENLSLYLLIFLNRDWLFPCAFDIVLDLTSYQITEKTDEIYEMKIIEYYGEELTLNDLEDNMEKVDKVIQKILDSKNQNGDSIEEENEKSKNKKSKEFNEKLQKNFLNMIKENYNNIDLIFLFIDFIKQFSFLNKFTIKLPDVFVNELKEYMKFKQLENLTDFHFIHYLSTINNFRELDLYFNPLETDSFDNFMFMIKHSKNLQKLKIELFPTNEIFNNNAHFLKIQEGNIVQNDEKSKTKEIKNVFDVKDILIETFEKNMERFFLFLRTLENTKLDSFTLIINDSFVLKTNEGFWIIMKFLFNFFLELNRELISLKELKIILPKYNFNNDKYPFIETFFNGINLKDKTLKLTDFHFETQITKLPNLGNLISNNLTTIFLGDIDTETLKGFVDFFHTEDFIKNSKLKTLTINLNKNVNSFSDCKNEITDLFQGVNPQNLYEVALKCYFNISIEDLSELLEKANGNNVERYTFSMIMAYEKDYNRIIRGGYYYYSNSKFIKMIKKNMGLIMNYKFYEEKNKNIAKKLIRYLLPSNKKKIIFIKI